MGDCGSRFVFIQEVIALILAGEKSLLAVVGSNSWVLVLFYQFCCFLPIPFIFRAGFKRSLLVHLLSQVFVVIEVMTIYAILGVRLQSD